MEIYYPFKGEPGGIIAVELFHSGSSVPSHMHDFNEFVLITRGSCKHCYYGEEVPLIPGDVFLVPAHNPHSYIVNKSLTNYNVQFYPQRLDERWGKLWEPTPYESIKASPADNDIRSHKLLPDTKKLKIDDTTNLNKLGILRLNTAENDYVSGILAEMLREQEQELLDFERMLRAHLEIILVIFSRVHSRQLFHAPETLPASHQEVRGALAYIEEHFIEKINFAELAAQSYLSSSHFRTVFKGVTGLSPVDYLNKLRIIKSLQYLQAGNLPISDVAASVGINDSNYFSRLFKTIVGYPPKHFKARNTKSA